MTQVTDPVRRQFGGTADAYANSTFHSSGPDLARLVEAAAFTGSERVLDMGCGPGHTALAAARHAREVVGLDLTPEMVAKATALATERKLANATFQVGNVMALPFDDTSFDVVTSRVSAHHYSDPGRALSEAARVLKPGGLFLLSDTISPEDPTLDTFLNVIEFLRDASHVRDWRGSEWVRMFATAGFEAEVLERFPLALDGLEWVTRMRTPPEKAAMLRTLFREASPPVRAAFEISDEPWGYTIPITLMRARLKG
jgi:SAM-dependent methyltransferase